MDIKERFYKEFNNWIRYCKKPDVQISSNARKATYCKAYKNLVKMGTKILPCIREAYNLPARRIGEETVILRGFNILLYDIVGNINSELENILTLEEAKEFNKKWLDENMHRFTA